MSTISRIYVAYYERLTIDKNKNVTTIIKNGVIIYTDTIDFQQFSSSINLVIGATNTNNVIQNFYNGKIYNYQIYKDDVLVQDAVFVPQGSTRFSTTPAPSNCIWDKVDKKYILMSGTGFLEIVEQPVIN